MFGKLRSVTSSKSISSGNLNLNSAPTKPVGASSVTNGDGVSGGAVAVEEASGTSDESGSSGQGKVSHISTTSLNTTSSLSLSVSDGLPTNDSTPAAVSTPAASADVPPSATPSVVVTTSSSSAAVTGINSGSISGATKRSSLFQSAPLKKASGSGSATSSSSSSSSSSSLSIASSDVSSSDKHPAEKVSSASTSTPTSSRSESKVVSSSSSLEGQLEAEKRKADAAEQRASFSDAKIANLNAQLLEATTALNKVTETRNLERTLHQNDDIYREQLAKEQSKAKEDINRLVSRVASLQNELSKTQALNGRQASSNTDLTNQLELVKARLSTVEVQAAEASELRLKLAQLKEQNEKLNAGLVQAHEDRDLAESLLASARSKAEKAVSIPLADALERIEDAERRSTMHLHEIEGLKKRLHEASKAESEIFSARKSVNHSSEILTRAHAIEAEAKASLLPLTSELENLRSVNNALSRDNAALSSSEARLKMMNAEANVKVKQAEAARYEAASVSDKLRSDLILYSSQMQTLQTELTAARLTIALAEEREAAAVTLQQQTLHQAQQHLRSPKKESAQSLLSPGPDGHKKMNAALDPPSPTLTFNLSSAPIPGTPSAADRAGESSAIKSAASRFPSLAALAAPPSTSSYAPPTIPAGLTTPSRAKSSKPSVTVVSTPGGSNSLPLSSSSSSSSNSATAAHNATVAALQRASAMVSDTRSQLRAESDECVRLRSVIICLKAKVFANRLDSLGKIRVRDSLKKWAAEVKRSRDRESILSLKDRAAAVVARMHARSTAQAKSQSLRNAFYALLHEARKQKSIARVGASTRRRVLRRAISHWTRGALVFEARRAVVAAATDMKDQASVIIAAARTALETTRSENSKLEKALLASHQQLRDVEGGGAAINAEILLLRSQSFERTNEIERLTSEILSLRESLVRAELVHEGLNRDKTALTERLESEFNARAEVESNLRISTLREEALVLKMSATEATITQLRDQLLLLSAERSALEKSKSSLNDALLGIQKETSEAKTRRDELEVQIGYRVKERDAALAAERASAAALLDSRTETAEARAHAVSANEASAAMSLSIEHLKKENETLLESFHQTRLANSRLEDRISGLLLSLGADADRLRSAKLDLHSLDSRCLAAEARAESLLASLSSCQEELRVCREENRKNAQAASNEARKAAASENELKTLSAQLAKAMTSDTSHIGERNSARADMLAKESQLADAKAQIQVLEATVNKLQSSIEYLTKDRDDARTDLNSTSSALALARSHFDSAEAAHAETFRLMEKRIADEGAASARRESEAREAGAQLLALVRDDMSKEVERVRLSHSIEIERLQSMHSVEIASLRSEVMSATSLARAEFAAKENKLIADIYDAQKVAQQAKADAKALIMAETAMMREQLQKDRDEVAEAKRIAERDVAEVLAVGSESTMRINALTARVKSLTEQRGKVDEEVYKLQIEKKEFKTQLADMQSKVERSERDQKKAALAISQAQALREQVMKDREEFQKALSLNSANAAKIDSTPNKNNNGASSAVLEEEVKTLREKCASLQEKVDQLQSASSQNSTTSSSAAKTSSATSSSSSSSSATFTSSVSSSSAAKSPISMSGGGGGGGSIKGGPFSSNKLSSPVVGASTKSTNLDEPVAASPSPAPSFAAAPVEIKPGPKPGGPKPSAAASSVSGGSGGGGKGSWGAKDSSSASSSPAASGAGSDSKNIPLSPSKVGSATGAGSKFGGSSSSSSSASLAKPNSIGSGSSSSSSPASSSASKMNVTIGGSGGVKTFASTSLKSPSQGTVATNQSSSTSPFGSSKLKSNASTPTSSLSSSSSSSLSSSAASASLSSSNVNSNAQATRETSVVAEAALSTVPAPSPVPDATAETTASTSSSDKAIDVVAPILATTTRESDTEASASSTAASAQEDASLKMRQLEEETKKKKEEEEAAEAAAAAVEQAKKAEALAIEEAKRRAAEEEEVAKAKKKLLEEEEEAKANKERAEVEAAAAAAAKKMEDEKAAAAEEALANEKASTKTVAPASQSKKAVEESDDEEESEDEDESETDSEEEN